MDKDTYYRTRTLDIGAFIMASGIPLVDVESLYGDVFIMVFENPQKCRELEQKFYSGASIDAQKLLASKSELMKTINGRKNTMRKGTSGR